MNRTKGGSIRNYIWPWNVQDMRVRAHITEDTKADCTQAKRLIKDTSAEYLLADRGYDSDAIIAQAKKQGMRPVIPPRRTRKEQQSYDKAFHSLRHPVENAFLHLKRGRGIATRYAKNAASFLAAVQIRCLALWVEIS